MIEIMHSKLITGTESTVHACMVPCCSIMQNNVVLLVHPHAASSTTSFTPTYIGADAFVPHLQTNFLVGMENEANENKGRHEKITSLQYCAIDPIKLIRGRTPVLPPSRIILDPPVLVTNDCSVTLSLSLFFYTHMFPFSLSPPLIRAVERKR